MNKPAFQILAVALALLSISRVAAASVPTTAAGAPAKYIGSTYCYACHLEISLEFAKTKMGKAFLINPQNDIERKGCEGCHGPGGNHAMVGGGLGVGGLIEFRIDPDHNQPIADANRACIDCHDEALWHGKTHDLRRLACFDCHVVMSRASRTSQLAPALLPPANNRATWISIALAGLLLGVVSGITMRTWRRA